MRLAEVTQPQASREIIAVALSVTPVASVKKLK